MDKNAIKKYAVWARRELLSRVAQKALQYGVDGTTPADPDAEIINGRLLTAAEKSQRRALIDAIAADGYEQILEEAAYTWFNRFCALRFMEVNNYLPSHTRVFTDENNAFAPQILAEAIRIELPGLDRDLVHKYKEANDDDALYKYLLITQCNALKEILPGMFSEISGYTELLFPDNLLREGSAVEQMIAMIPEDDWRDEVQIIGWLYQYYNSEKKDAVFAALKKNVKISKDNIPAATQLFTPDWIVRYMVENSLGRLWVQGHPAAPIKAEWKYYLEDAAQTPEVESRLAPLRQSYAALTPEQLTCIDPCCGSGHILVYLFDVLMQIYTDYGYTSREAVESIVQNNLYGLDIDRRAAQLAYFAVMMTARRHDRGFLRHPVQPHVYAIAESNAVDKGAVEVFCNGDAKLTAAVAQILTEMHDAREYGSILTTTPQDWAALYTRFEELDAGNGMEKAALLRLKSIVQAAELLSKTYCVSITNPPYMGNKGFTSKLLTYITGNYLYGKIDMYAVYILRCIKFTKPQYMYSLVTPESWMFLSRFEKLRRSFFGENTFTTLLHLGFHAFECGFGTVAFTAIKESSFPYLATCYRLVDYNTPEEKENAISTDKPFFSSQEAYRLVDGMPVCYWASHALLHNFVNTAIKDHGKTCVGLLTGDNERFLRYWYEADFKSVGIGLTHEEAKLQNEKKWFPINQYGEYRKWYGNNMIIFDWWNDGYNIKKFKMDRFLVGEAEKKNSMCWNEDTYFMPGITWNRISTTKFSARMSPLGNTAGSSSPIYFPQKREKYLLALFNSCVFSEIVSFLNPTVSFQTADIEKVPVLWGPLDVDNIAEENISLAKQDWDSFETSWDFKRHPLV